MKILEVPNITDDQALESIAQVIALEAMGLQSIVARAADLIPTLVHNAKTMIAHNSDKPDLAPLNINSFVLERCFTNGAYSDIVSLNHPIPEGFVGNLYEYSELLRKQVNYINGTPGRIMAFNQYISELISSAQHRRTITGKADDYRDMATSRKVLLAESRNFFGGTNSRVATAKYGDIIASNSQYMSFSKNVAEIIDLAAKTSFAGTEKLIADAKEILQGLSEAARSGGMTELSNPAFDTIGAYTETIAREVEMYSVVLNALAQLREVVVAGNAKMIQALR